jgi:hypothetical protein
MSASSHVCIAEFDPVSRIFVKCKNTTDGKLHCEYHRKFVANSCKRYKRQSCKVKKLKKELNFETASINSLMVLLGNIKEEKDMRLEHLKRYYKQSDLSKQSDIGGQSEDRHLQHIVILDELIERCNKWLDKKYNQSQENAKATPPLIGIEQEQEEEIIILPPPEKRQKTKNKKRETKKDKLLDKYFEVERMERAETGRLVDYITELAKKYCLDWKISPEKEVLFYMEMPFMCRFDSRNLEAFDIVQQIMLCLYLAITSPSFVKENYKPILVNRIGYFKFMNGQILSGLKFADFPNVNSTSYLKSMCEVFENSTNLKGMCRLVFDKIQQKPVYLTLFNFNRGENIIVTAASQERTKFFFEKAEKLRIAEQRYKKTYRGSIKFAKICKEIDLYGLVKNSDEALCEIFRN